MARRRKKKRKVRFKKRFYVFCILAVLIIFSLIFFGIRGIVHIVSDHTGGGDQKVEQQEEKDTDRIKSMDDLLAVESADMVLSEDDSNSGTTEEELVDAVLKSYYISNLGTTREDMEGRYGKLVRSEEWNGTIYYHKGFSDTMYVTYKGKLGKDNFPVMDAECTSLSIAWSFVKESFKSFTPDKSLWGTVHVEDNSLDEGYFYSIRIRDDVKLIAYCDKNGKITKDSHIIMSLV